MGKITIERAGKQSEVEATIFSKPEALRPLLNKDCWEIFCALARKPMFPAQIAKELGLNEQKVYYYIKQLRNTGLIEIERTEERNGAVAKYYSAVSGAFALVPEGFAGSNEQKVSGGAGAGKKEPPFLKEFSKKGIFSGKIVVGSPDPHGKFKARARDGHLSAELAAFIGARFGGFTLPLVYLDTMVHDLKDENSNLIIIGGPLTNKLAGQLNESSPIKFVPSGGNWVVKSPLSGKEYNDDSIGIVVKIPHPYFRGRHIIMLAGKRNSGTIAAILSLTKKSKELEKPNNFDSRHFCRVVEGLDLDGDGMIDDVEFRE